MKINGWVQYKNKNNAAKEPVPQTVVEKSETGHNDRPVFIHRFKGSESSEFITRFEYKIELIKQLPN